MNEQNKSLLTIHDLLGRVGPELRRADIPIIIRILAYFAAGYELMSRLYVDKPVECLTTWSGIRRGKVKPYF
ncbi:hypothetical protein EAF00_009128 [Botryotinia globosa]|nr:hypothetical protein EAF00_009128 [Botryotinia globosa]